MPITNIHEIQVHDMIEIKVPKEPNLPTTGTVKGVGTNHLVVDFQQKAPFVIHKNLVIGLTKNNKPETNQKLYNRFKR